MHGAGIVVYDASFAMRHPSPTQNQSFFAVAGRYACLAGAALAAALYVTVFPVKSFGIFGRIEVAVAAFFAAGALCALGIALSAAAARRRALRSPLALIFAALGIWSAAMAPFAEFPWRSMLGPPQTGQGAFALFAWAAIAGAIAAQADRRTARGLAWLSATGAVAAAATHLLPEALRPFENPAYFAWLGVVACASLWATYRQPGPRLVAIAVLVICLAVSENRSAMAICLAIGLPAYVLARALSARVLAAVAVLVTPMATAAIWAIGTGGWGQSIIARARIYDVFVAFFADNPLALAVGAGWGGAIEAFFRYLPAGAELLYGDGWDVPVRDFHSSHNLALEFWISSGLPGLVVAIALPAIVVLGARRRDLSVAVAFACVFAALSTLWHQQSFNLGPTIVAIALIARRPLGLHMPSRLPSRIATAFVAIALMVAVGRLVDFGLRAAQARTASPPAACLIDYPDDPARGDIGLRYALYGLTQPILFGEREPDPLRIAAYVCAVERRLAAHPSLHLALAAVLYRAEAAAVPALAPESPPLDLLLADWGVRVGQLLDFAPRRSDLAVAYLANLAARGDADTMRRLAGRILSYDSRDPVGLWFAGMAGLLIGDPTLRPGSLRSMRQALDLGLARILPLPEETIKIIISD